MESLLARHDVAIESDEIKLSPLLEIDSETQRFTGEHAEMSNQFMRRKYRKGFEVPEIALAAAE
jgi:hypothetical protein